VANIKSQIKRNRQNEAARLRNKSVKSTLKTAVRRFHEAVDAGEADKAQESAREGRPPARQGRQQGRHPREPGRQPQVGHLQEGRFSLKQPANDRPVPATGRSFLRT
jgi:ribosomal protein S20